MCLEALKMFKQRPMSISQENIYSAFPPLLELFGIIGMFDSTAPIFA